MVEGGGIVKRTRQHRKITRGIAQVVLNMNEFFLKERHGTDRISLGDVITRVRRATKVGRNIACKINAQVNLEKFDRYVNDKRNRNMTVYNAFVCIIRRTLRELIIMEKPLPTLDNILGKI